MNRYCLSEYLEEADLLCQKYIGGYNEFIEEHTEAFNLLIDLFVDIVNTVLKENQADFYRIVCRTCKIYKQKTSFKFIAVTDYNSAVAKALSLSYNVPEKAFKDLEEWTAKLLKIPEPSIWLSLEG